MKNLHGCTPQERASFYASQHGGPIPALDTAPQHLDTRALYCLLALAIKELHHAMVHAPD